MMRNRYRRLAVYQDSAETACLMLVRLSDNSQELGTRMGRVSEDIQAKVHSWTVSRLTTVSQSGGFLHFPTLLRTMMA